MKKRKMSALQRKHFGKKHKVVRHTSPKKTRRKTIMAKRKGGYHRSRGGLGIGGFKSFLPPILSGVADSYLDPMLPIDGVGATAVGMFMHNETMKNIGLYKVGFSLGNILPLPGRTGTSQGGLL